MHQLTRQQLVVLVLLTLFWGCNWPVMKLGVTELPPLGFRALSIGFGVPVLALGLVLLKVPFRLPRRHWPQLLLLSATNMFIWHACMILALRSLSSGRAAILGYTMPIFSAVLGAWLFAAPLPRRAWLGVAAAAGGAGLLLWHELSGLSGKPGGVALALLAAATWALGTQLLRRARFDVPMLTISFWMTVITAVAMSLFAVLAEGRLWTAPSPTGWFALLYNGAVIFGFAHAAWFYLARTLPAVASTLSVMLVPVLGVFSGALVLGEVLHWQDWAAVALMVGAIGSVLLPARR